MRIAWFTPLCKRSAIGEFSVHVTAELAKQAEVELWTSDPSPYHDTDLRIVPYTSKSTDLDLLAQREAIVYNMGDYLPFHGEIDIVARRYPGVVILHDRVLHHPYAGLWLTRSENSHQTYIERMGAYYGDVGAEAASQSLRGHRDPVWECDREVLRYPLFEEAIVNARGVVTHSEDQAHDIRARWLGPVLALHLPCYGEVLSRVDPTPPGPSDGEPMHVVTVGHVNPNKQIHRLVEMLANDHGLAKRVHYTVAGPDDGFAEYVKSIRELVDRHRGRISVEMTGWLPSEELERLMHRADIFVNLRHPVMEGSSASLMQQLAYGRPVVCFDGGFFGELPDEAVMRVSDGDFAAVAAALRTLVDDRKLRLSIGEKARALASSYDERSYTDGLMGLIEKSRRAGPTLGLLDSVGRRLGEMGVNTRLPVFDEIAEDFGRTLVI